MITNSAAFGAAILLTVTRELVPSYGIVYRPYLLLAWLPSIIQIILTIVLRDSCSEDNGDSVGRLSDCVQPTAVSRTDFLILANVLLTEV